jgi:hypothetical protein
MLKKLGIWLLFALFLLPAPGCMTNKPYLWSWPHHKRRLNKMLEDWHALHMDLDRILFDMDERPLEDVD